MCPVSPVMVTDTVKKNEKESFSFFQAVTSCPI